ncbi:MAG: hypothetical protein Q3988_06365 [Gemella sp.]|nr:hypothetical protein [Gemella sp.]
MKKFKKLSLIMGLSSLALLTTACAQLDKIGEDISNHASQPAETTTTQKLSETDTIRRIIGKMNAMKSWEVASETKIKQEQAGAGGFEGTSTILTQYTANPYIFKSEETISDGTIQSAYVKDGVQYRYIKSQGNENWTKGTIPGDKLINFKRNHIATYYRAFGAILEKNKDFTFKDNGSTYEISFKPANADEYKEFLFGTNPSVKDFKIESYSAKYIIDKVTLIPTSIEREEVISYTTDKDVKIKSSNTIIDRFKNVNQVKDITIPDGHKNAKDEIKFD